MGAWYGGNVRRGTAATPVVEWKHGRREAVRSARGHAARGDGGSGADVSAGCWKPAVAEMPRCLGPVAARRGDARHRLGQRALDARVQNRFSLTCFDQVFLQKVELKCTKV
jgi:hypothetical protein